MERFAKPRFPQPAKPRPAAIEIECRQTVLGIRVAGQMRLGEQIETGDAAGVWKRMPVAGTDDVEFEFAEQPIAERLHRRQVAESLRIAIQRLDDPLNAHERRSGT